jgi:3-oxoacyl-[acyl-carrier protein] reductase
MEKKVALITGAGRGIGEALALGFAKAGLNLVLTARSQDQLDAIKTKCEAAGAEVIVHTADVSKYEDVAKLVQTALAKFGKIDVLVNNAGYSRLKRIERIKIEEFQAILNTNVLGVYNCTHAIVPSMLEKGTGAIINTGSLIINSPGPKWSAYAMSKSALIGFTESLAAELKPKITINTIMPNIVNTPLFREGLTPEQVEAMNPMDPNRLIPYYLFFTTEEAKKITGVMVDVDIVEATLKLVPHLPVDIQGAPSWQTLEPVAQEKMSPDDFKKAKKMRKLIDYLLTYKPV